MNIQLSRRIRPSEVKEMGRSARLLVSECVSISTVRGRRSVFIGRRLNGEGREREEGGDDIIGGRQRKRRGEGRYTRKTKERVNKGADGQD
jgi:hypothetical protein